MKWMGIQQLRKDCGITAKEMGEKIGKDATYISKIEKGNIVNTSYETIMAMASVVADSDVVKNNKVDLSRYDTEFAKLVLCCRYDYVKDIYKYVTQNKEIEQYSKVVRNLLESDLDTFNALINYRRLNKEYSDLKEKLEEEISNEIKEKSIKKYLKDLAKDNAQIKINIEIDVKDLLEYNFDKCVKEIIFDSMINEIEKIKISGIKGCSSQDYYEISNAFDDVETEITEVKEEIR
ncbi:helix-turn-helix domain-containing protein [Clostridium butyricum]|uniref:helix-turn-helix domain-containing protein n=1 Tax=Clostridium butyricum TaxID=1492 RepID=UPI003D32A4E6